MNSATKVGEIFTKAGESFHKMADMTMMLDAKAQDLNVTSVKKQVRMSPVLIFFRLEQIYVFLCGCGYLLGKIRSAEKFSFYYFEVRS